MKKTHMGQEKAAGKRGILGREPFGVSQEAHSVFQAEAGSEGKHFSALPTGKQQPHQVTATFNVTAWFRLQFAFISS